MPQLLLKRACRDAQTRILLSNKLLLEFCNRVLSFRSLVPDFVAKREFRDNFVTSPIVAKREFRDNFVTSDFVAKREFRDSFVTSVLLRNGSFVAVS